MPLFKLDSCASFFKLLLDVFSFVFISTFFHSSRRAFYCFFCFFQTQASYTTYRFNNSNFVVAETSQYYIKLIFGSSSFTASVAASSTQI